MATYCTDADMQNIRSNILDLGVSSWETQRTQAYDYINKLFIARWYRPAAIEQGFDPDDTEFDPTKIDSDQIKRCAALKSLEFAYMYLMLDAEDPTGFERNMNTFAKEFVKCFDLEMAIGIKYDWDSDGDTSDEEYIKTARRLYRS